MPQGDAAKPVLKELILGIDLGYEFCGVSYVDTLGRLQNRYTIQTPRKDAIEHRLELVHQQLDLAIGSPGVVAVGYEDPYRTGKAKQKSGQTNYNPMLLMLIGGYVQSLCWKASLRCYPAEPQMLKRGVVGKGASHATKEQVRRAVEIITGIRMNEHEADATAAAIVTARKHRVASRGLTH